MLIEKHWRSVTPRAVCDLFWDEVGNYPDKEVRCLIRWSIDAGARARRVECMRAVCV